MNIRLVAPGKLSDVHERRDVQRELKEDREKDVKVEDVAERPFTGELLDRLQQSFFIKNSKPLGQKPTHLRPRNAQEADRHEHAGDRHLVVTELDAVEVLHTQTVCGDEAVEG